MKKKLFVFFSLALIINLLSFNLIGVNAMEMDKNEIEEFLSLCNISQYNNLSYSNSINTYKDKVLVNDENNYLIFSNDNIIGMLNYSDGNFIYTDLSDKIINNYNVNKIYSVEYIENDILIFFNSFSFSLTNNNFVDEIYSINKSGNFKLNNISIIQSRASSKYLSIPIYQQDTSYTCWATCIASVAKYKGKPYIVPSTISKNYGINPSQKGATLDETRLAMKSQFGISSESVYTGPSASEIISLINSSKPIITGFNCGTAGHMVVIRGYAEGSSYLTVSYMDPYTATIKTSQITTDRKIKFSLGSYTYISTCYLKLS